MDGDIFVDGGVVRRGTGICIPEKFTPSNWLANPAPDLIFCMRPSLLLERYPNIPRERFLHYQDRHTALVFTDGCCLNNGQHNARAGWAFYFGPDPQKRTVSRRLESRGPFGDLAEQTSNRAELRAAIAAIDGLHWCADRIHRLVIASDSEYLVEGITTWVRLWTKNRWKTVDGEPFRNKDLWQMLLGDVELWASHGGDIEFWRIPREYNTVADRAAKKAAEQADVEEFDTTIMANLY